MKLLLDSLWDSLAAALRDSSDPRSRASGIPLDICNQLSLLAYEKGIEGRLLLVYSDDASEGAFPLKGGFSARLGMGALTACRNSVPRASYLMVVPGGVRPEDTLYTDVASEIADVIESVEEAFYSRASREEGFSIETHKRLCKSALKDTPRPDFDAFRWATLRQVSELLEQGWPFPIAYAAAIGVPCDPASTFAGDLSDKVLIKLQKYSANKSRAEGRDALLAFVDSVEESDFDRAEVKRAVSSFYRWAGESGSWSTADDWKTAYQLFRHKPVLAEQMSDELVWRTSLSVPVLRWLLSGQPGDTKVRAKILNQEGHEIDPVGGSLTNAFLVGSKFTLSLVEDGEDGGGEMQSAWTLKSKAGRPVKLSEALRHEIDADGELLPEGAFSTDVASVGRHGEKSVKVSLINLTLDDVGYRVFVPKGDLSSPVIQPAELKPGRITLESSESIDVILAYDKSRWLLASASFDGSSLAHYADTDVVSAGDVGIVRFAPVDCDGQQQVLVLDLRRKGGGQTRLEVNIHSETVSDHGYRSWLHYLAACHVAQRRLPFSLDAAASEPLVKLAAAAWSFNGEGRPVVVEVGKPVEDMVFIEAPKSGGAYAIYGDSVAISRAYDKQIPKFSVPEAVSKSRSAYLAAVVGAGGTSGIFAADLSSTKVKAAQVAYLKSVDEWIRSDEKTALSYLEWMDTIHFYLQNSGGHGRAIGFFVLPTHPLVALGLSGMSDLLLPSKELRRPYRPPLARLFSSVGPRSWVVVNSGRPLVYDLRNVNDHYFRLYAARESSESDLQQLDKYLNDELKVKIGDANLSLSGRDVASVMDDICSLNPALTEVTVKVASDKSGAVARGLLDWFRELDDAASPEHAGWSASQPLSLAVYSSREVTEGCDVDGIIASLHDHPKNHLKWYVEEAGRGGESSRYDFSIYGELASQEALSNPNGQGYPEAVALPAVGASLWLTYLADAGSREYSRSCGEGHAPEVMRNTSFKSTYSLHALLERWNPFLVSAHRHVCYGDTGIANQLSLSSFIALPISGSSDMQAVAGVDPESAVWKFENAEFDIHQTATAGHVILTSKLDLIRSRLTSVLMSAGINIDETEARRLLLQMGRAGINTLHSVTDNEMVILGAVSSLAVMRSFCGLPVPRVENDSFVGCYVLPLDSYGRVFQQLNKGGTRPDFLCFTLTRLSGQLNVQIDVLEAKWRKDTPSHQDLLDMIEDQVDPFVAALAPYFDATSPGASSVSAAILVSELVSSAIRLSEANMPDGGAPHELSGAKAIAQITAELLSGNSVIHFAKNKVLMCVSGDRDAAAGFKIEADGKCVATMSVRDAVEIIRGTADFSVSWGGERHPVSVAPLSQPSPAPVASLPGGSEAVAGSPVPVPVSPVPEIPKATTTPSAISASQNPPESVGPAAQAVVDNWPPTKNQFGLIGQDNAVSRLVSKIAMQKMLKKRFSDTMFIGPAGVGKSTFARSIAKELDLDCIFLSGTDVTGPDAIVRVLVEKGKILTGRGSVMVQPCIIFIDEVHAISSKAANFLLNATDEKRTATLDGREYDFRSVIMLTATTDSGKLSTAFLSRFDDIPLPAYTPEELGAIIHLKGAQMIPGLNLARDACVEIAIRLRLSPRRAILSFENQVMANFIAKTGQSDPESLRLIVNQAAVAQFFNQLGIDKNGLTNRDMLCIRALDSESPMPRDRLSGRLKITNVQEYSEMIEYLTRLGLVTVDSRGVSITRSGKSYVASGVDVPDLVRG